MRGKCVSPFPVGPDGRPLYPGARLRADGVVVVPGDLVLNDPRFAKVEWESCPVALVGHRDCPENSATEGWITQVFETANWISQGNSLRDWCPAPTPALKEAVLVVQRENKRRCDAENPRK